MARRFKLVGGGGWSAEAEARSSDAATIARLVIKIRAPIASSGGRSYFRRSFLLCIALLFPRLEVRARCESTPTTATTNPPHTPNTPSLTRSPPPPPIPPIPGTSPTHRDSRRRRSRLFFYCISQTHDLRSPYHARLGDCLHGAGAPGRQRHHAPGRRPDARPPDVGRQLWPPCAARGSHHWHGGPRRRVDGRLGGGAALDAVVLLHLPRRGREVRAQPSHLRAAYPPLLYARLTVCVPSTPLPLLLAAT